MAMKGYTTFPQILELKSLLDGLMLYPEHLQGEGVCPRAPADRIIQNII